MPELFLASTSPHRRRLLADAGLAVTCEGPGVDERAVAIADPVRLARALALQKARAVLARHPQAWVIGADQVADDLGPSGRVDDFGGPPFGKPADPADHLARLRALVGRKHALVTGFCIVGPRSEHVDHEITVMHVRADLEDDELRAYVATGEGSGCAGGYAAEGRGIFLFDRIDGDWTNVIGLPVLRVIGVLRELGWRFGG
jgi:septum formation protein